MAGPSELQLGDDDAGNAAGKADREVDLSDQEHEDHADRDHDHGGRLLDQVLEVGRREEEAVLEVQESRSGLVREEDRDRDDPDDHRQAADIPRSDRVPAGAKDRGDAVLVLGGGLDLGRRRRAHALTSTSSGAGAPKVIASTISCWVDFSFS